ncbi:MAG: porphobilinogen synthase, partial [Bacteroidota bacterium]|nr:porphobilinogen synthase [Bacteroidota bacterium]
ENGALQQSIRVIKEIFPGITVMTDVCVCSYTDHGHCGIVEEGNVINDLSLQILTKMAVSHARAGADVVAPSAMMDGQVEAIRKGLDNEGYQNVNIMAYSAKYFSSCYGPFREAADSAPQFGSRASYQMDPANVREALKEVDMDIKEGADIVMVKPALFYLDIITKVKSRTQVPVAAYNVSGEYSMIIAAAERGWINQDATMMECLLSIKRAGADLIITYFAKEAARYLSKN